MTFFNVVQCPVDFNTDHGKITVHDGYAAGSMWILVEFLEGDLKGTKVWMNCCDTDAVYIPHQTDDGVLFNRDPARPFDADQEECEGGAYRPDLDRLEIHLI